MITIEWVSNCYLRGAFVRGIPQHRSIAWRAERMAYACGDLPPRYPMPAILTDHALHMRYPRVLSEGDKANADDYFWRLYHRLYGKK